jgi:plasmid rolling circle replication initiator protein Rep
MLSETSDAFSLSGQDNGCNAPADLGITEPEYLSECSPRDKPWDKHRSEADLVTNIYLDARESRWLRRLGERMDQCAQVLEYGFAEEKGGSGVLTLKLRNAYFCRVRHCPVCQWRRSLMWMARFYAALPRLLEQHPKTVFVFLVLTVRNVPIVELRDTIQKMGKAWGRLTKRKEFGAVLGWIRTVEVTRGKDGSSHPHFNALLAVHEEYFRHRRGFVTHPGWISMWRDALRVDYDPSVRVRRARLSSKGRGGRAVTDAAKEVLKYSVKPEHMTADRDWFLELTRQSHKLRFIASGGILKDVLKEDDEKNDDLLVLGNGETEDGPRLRFDWWRPVSRYKRRGSTQ